MKHLKRSLLLLLIVSLLAPMLALSQPIAQAASSYDPYKAIAYAEANWDSGKGLCAEFVWNCLIAGGLNISASGLHESPYVTTGVAEAACRAIGKPYTGVKDFPLVATDSRFGPSLAYKNHPSNQAISIGDLLFVYCETCGKTPHVVICSGYHDDSMVCVYGHNYAQQHSFFLPAGANAGGHEGHQFSMRYLDLSDVEEYNCECKELFDVPKSAWYHEYVHDALNMGLMSGVSDYSFAPEDSMTRAMVVTVLYRYNYAPETAAPTFSDVEMQSWYTDAISWAAENGIVGGIGNNRFDPNGNVTREQLAAILYRYTAYMGNDCSATASLSAFPDAGKVSAWAVDAMQWAVAEGLINGSDGKLLPQGNATRTQVAAILIRYINQYGVIAKEGRCGDNLTWALSTDGTLTISGEGAMWQNIPSEDSWANQAPFVKRFVAEDGVTSLLSEIFYYRDFTSLQSVHLADSVIELNSESFSGCRKLTDVHLSNSLQTLPWGIFLDCSALSSIELPDSLTKIGSNAFENCRALNQIALPDGLEHIETEAFRNCTSLREVILPQTLTWISANSFEGCTGLTSLTIPASVETISVSTQTYELLPCRVEVDEANPNYCNDDSGVLFTKDMSALLCAPKSLHGNYQIPETVTSIDNYAFAGCSELTSITMSDAVESIGLYAFAYCGKLQSIKLSTQLKELNNGAFSYCASLKSITIPDGVEELYDFTFFSCTSLQQLTLPQNLVHIGSYSFNECYSLKDFIVPPKVSNIYHQDFTHCYQLRNIYFMGDAPEIFRAQGGILTLRYIAGKDGWTSPTWNDYPTATWTP